MKLKYTFKTVQIGDDMVAVPIDDSVYGFRGAIHVNEIAADVLSYLAEDTSENAIVSQLMKEYDATESQIRDSVHHVIEILQSEELLVE